MDPIELKKSAERIKKEEEENRDKQKYPNYNNHTKGTINKIICYEFEII